MNCNSKYTLTYQKGPIDCGPASLMMIILYYGIKTSYEEICNMCNMSSRGVSVYSLCLCAKLFGFEVAALKTETINLIKNIPLPAILYWKEKHFSVLFQANKDIILIGDPIKGFIKYSKEDFTSKWYLKDKNYGILIAISPK